jgi:hypothetical protein
VLTAAAADRSSNNAQAPEPGQPSSCSQTHISCNRRGTNPTGTTTWLHHLRPLRGGERLLLLPLLLLLLRLLEPLLVLLPLPLDLLLLLLRLLLRLLLLRLLPRPERGAGEAGRLPAA